MRARDKPDECGEPAAPRHRALVSLGSNVSPGTHLPQAVALLRGRCDVARVSSAWQTPPVGPPGQPLFLNAAVLLRTDLEPAAVRSELLRPIEDELGRRRPADPFAPRTIDLDLVLFTGDPDREGSKSLGDPELLEHPHVALPSAEIAPDLRHPLSGETLGEIRRRLLQTSSETCRRMRRRPDVALGS